MKSIRRICLGIACISIALGIILVVLSFSIGGKQMIYNSDATYSFEDTVEGVKSINVDVAFGTVNIVNGDSFHINMKNITEDGYESYVKDGIWYIKNKEDSDFSFNLFGNDIRFFSFNFLGVHIGDSFPIITIEVPESFSAEDIKVDIGSGDFNADFIRGKQVELYVGAGSMEVDKLIASNKTTLECGAGEFVVDELDTKDANFECGMGSIDITGSIKGDTYADNGIGSIYLNLAGNSEDYNYYVDCGIGSVIINNKSYSGITEKTIRNNNPVGTFELECGIGEIEIQVR